MDDSKNKLATINIKITKVQRDWLTKIADQIRDNNENPVPPQDRVFPQHLIGVAIDLLDSHDIDWEQIRNTEHSEPIYNYGFYAVLKVNSKPAKSSYDIEEKDGRKFPPIT